MQGIQFLTETGHWSTGKRQEFILMSDTLGVSMLVDALNYKASAGATESTVLGPFHREQAPEYPLGANISKNATDGEPCWCRGTVRDAEGQADRRRQARHLAGRRRRPLRLAEGRRDEPARRVPQPTRRGASTSAA